MNRAMLEEKVKEALEQHTKQGLTISTVAMQGPSMEELQQMYRFLAKPSKTKKVYRRPKCPDVTSERPSLGSKSLYTYKTRICKYIAETTGGRIRFEEPTLLTTGFLEATANYADTLR